MVPDEFASRNYVFFRETDDFAGALDSLVAAIDDLPEWAPCPYAASRARGGLEPEGQGQQPAATWQRPARRRGLARPAGRAPRTAANAAPERVHPREQAGDEPSPADHDRRDPHRARRDRAARRGRPPATQRGAGPAKRGGPAGAARDVEAARRRGAGGVARSPARPGAAARSGGIRARPERGGARRVAERARRELSASAGFSTIGRPRLPPSTLGARLSRWPDRRAASPCGIS